MNAMQHMASTLGVKTPHSYSKAAAIRHELVGGPKSGRALAQAIGVAPKDVGAIVKADIELGRIRVSITGRGNHRCGTYRLAEDFDGDLQEQLKAARALLIRHGYSVSLSRSGPQ